MTTMLFIKYYTFCPPLPKLQTLLKMSRSASISMICLNSFSPVVFDASILIPLFPRANFVCSPFLSATTPTAHHFDVAKQQAQRKNNTINIPEIVPASDWRKPAPKNGIWERKRWRVIRMNNFRHFKPINNAKSAMKTTCQPFTPRTLSLNGKEKEKKERSRSWSANKNKRTAFPWKTNKIRDFYPISRDYLAKLRASVACQTCLARHKPPSDWPASANIFSTALWRQRLAVWCDGRDGKIAHKHKRRRPLTLPRDVEQR